jgi:hypothetical protein
MSFSWKLVSTKLQRLVDEDANKPREEQHLDEGQRASLRWMAKRLPKNGVVLADEVGTGKTRIACAVVHAVMEAGGRAAVVVPHGLMHQWIAESRKLRANNPAPKELTTITEFLRDVSSNEDSWKDFSPRPDEPEWWLISHGFRAPLVRSNSYVWRAALPAFVQLHLTSRANRQDGRTWIGKLQREIEIKKEQTARWGWNGMARIAKDVAPRVHLRQNLLNRIKALPQLNVSSRNHDKFLAPFVNDGRGRQLTEELLGLWLGEFDLIVIDEAHKSRGEADVGETALGEASGTVLARLVDVLLKQPESGRRLCLTATPMELNLNQWSDLLQRTRADIEVGIVINDFQKAAQSAAIAPDEGARLDELCKSAENFQKSLENHVTRRRRTNSKEIQDFVEALDNKHRRCTHPHRNMAQISIPITKKTVGQESSWQEILFAAECMSQSARGLKQSTFENALQLRQNEESLSEKKKKRLKYLIRDLYSRIASGHLSADIFDEDIRIIPPENSDAVTFGKLQRTGYWLSKIQALIKSGLHEDEHPRILAAVEEIERWTLSGEKALVFGVFLRPLRLLRDVLNVRHSLRAADAGRPIAHNFHTDKMLFRIALRQLNRLRSEGALENRLKTGGDKELLKALADSHEKYVNDRNSVSGRTETLVKNWHKNPERGRWLKYSNIREGIQKHLIAFLVEVQLEQNQRIGHERLHELGEQFWNNHVEEELSDATGSNPDDPDTDAKLKRLREAFCSDENLRMRTHAVLLHGENRWSTRRYVQAAFNRSTSSPAVLIAQSQVGREGLNLHESCRVVVQFHAEWNPAVLEQQIGRVDRKGSLWEQRAQKWLTNEARGEPPFIEVRQLIFEGTYDAFQWDRVMGRQHTFDASLFGSLLPADTWDKVPEEYRQKLIEAAPSFDPIMRNS